MEVKQITEDRFIEFMAFDFPNFKITKSNLTYPCSQFVSSYYSLMLKHLIEINDAEEIWNLTENQRSYINSYHPETTTFIQHVWAHNLHSAVKYVFNQLGQNGTAFVYSDILFPENTPRRTLVFMSMMLNYYWCMSDFASDLNNIIAAVLEEVQAKENLKSDKERLLAQLKQYEDQKSQYAESYKDTKLFVSKFMELNEEKENIMKDLLEEEKNVQKNLEKVECEEQRLQDALTKVQNEKKYLESLIVSNPKQVMDIHSKQLMKKDEIVKNMKSLKEQVKIASNKLFQSNKVMELQQKLNLFLRNEKFLAESQGKYKGFKNIFDSINFLTEKKMNLAEEESSLKVKVLESEEMIPRLKSEYLLYETKQQEIMLKGKEKTGVYATLIDKQKKNHSQLFIKIKKDAEEAEELASSSADIDMQCNQIEEKINKIVSKNKEKYFTHVQEMISALNTVRGIFDDD